MLSHAHPEHPAQRTGSADISNTDADYDLASRTTSSITTVRDLEKLLGKSHRKRSLIPMSDDQKTIRWSDTFTYYEHKAPEHTPAYHDSSAATEKHSQSSTGSCSTVTTISNSTKNFTTDPPTMCSPKSEHETQALLSVHKTVPWPQDIIKVIKTIIDTQLPRISQSAFCFDLSQEAALKNYCILKKYNNNLATAIQHEANSPIAYGSEFRPIHILKPLLQFHPYWTQFQRLLKNGSDWPLAPNDSRPSDLMKALEFGNHKQAQEQPDLLRELVEDDVTHGFAMPIPLDRIHRIPGALLAPLNIAQQDSIDSKGRTIPKNRLTHDQSFVYQCATSSVNSRVDKSHLTPCIFGWVTRRLMNWIVAARRQYPHTRIYATKVDFKSARRCHLNHNTAIQSCTQLPVDNLALIPLRLTFGGAPCPYEWSVISETVCDLATAIVQHENWDPLTLYSPDQHLIPEPSFLDDDIPFGTGHELIVDIPINKHGTHEMYIDDLIGIGIDIPNSSNQLRSSRAPLLAIHTVARPSQQEEPIPRQNMVSINKLSAEAGLSEVKTILGWTWDLRRLIISLPKNKYVAWSEQIADTVNKKRITPKDLESLIGRIGHLALIIPQTYHFMSRLRELYTRARQQKRRVTQIPEVCILDLLFFQDLLQWSRTGIDMNLLAYRRPTHVYRSDACQTGIGGYAHTGHAWRYQLPENLRFRASINVLEHLAATITPWVDILANRISQGDCALSMTDSTTSAGWLHKTNFKEDLHHDEATVRLDIARAHARRYMHHKIRDYSQWFPGSENSVADSLSRDFHLSDIELTTSLRSTHPKQVPQNFTIVPLPNKIVLWMTSLLLQLTVKEQFKKAHTQTNTDHGNNGPTIAKQSVSQAISSSHLSQNSNEQKSLGLSQTPFGKGDIRDALSKPWLQQQSKIPSITWLRPSAKMVFQTQLKTKMVN